MDIKYKKGNIGFKWIFIEDRDKNNIVLERGDD